MRATPDQLSPPTQQFSTMAITTTVINRSVVAAPPVVSRSLRRLADTLLNVVDVRTGIVRYVAEQPRLPQFPDIIQYVAQTCDTKAFIQQAAFGNAGGCALSRPAALAKAIGEAVERYSVAIYDEACFPLLSYRDAPFAAIPPDSWALNSPMQYATPGFAWAPFTDVTPVRWVTARDLGTDKEIGVPAAMVYVPFSYYPASGEPPICQPISTGLACHCSYEEAMIGGLCEVIERDAFMITWQAGLSRTQIDPTTLSPVNTALIQRMEATGATLRLLDLTTDNGVAAVLAVQTHDSPKMPAITFASSAALDPEDAIRKALEEVTHTARWMYTLMHKAGPVPTSDGYTNVDSQERHLQFWADHAHRPLADFIFASDSMMAFTDMELLESGDPTRDLGTLIERISATGHRALSVDVTAPDVADAGLRVVRALVPGYHPLIMGYTDRATGGTRLWTVPQRLGYPGVDPASGDNPLPHPFP